MPTAGCWPPPVWIEPSGSGTPATGDVLRTLDGFKSPVWGVAFASERSLVGHQQRRGNDGNGPGLGPRQRNRGRLLRPGSATRPQSDDTPRSSFSPDGRWLAAACDDAAVQLWDMVAGHAARPLRGHTARVGSLAFSPDGRSLASASDDKTVKLWDLATGKEIVTLAGHTERGPKRCLLSRRPAPCILR